MSGSLEALADRIRAETVGLKIDHVTDNCVVCTTRGEQPGTWHVVQVRRWEDCRAFHLKTCEWRTAVPPAPPPPPTEPVGDDGLAQRLLF